MRILIITLIAIITSCSVETKPAFSEIAGENYTIQVMSLPMHGDDSETVGYKVRILPTQKNLDEHGKQLEERLWYQTDNSFYMTKGDSHINPGLVQPIATGMTNCYEFMLVFEGLPTTVNEELTLVFNDQHITDEKYLIKLTRKL